jgi:hypothetical protein
MDISSTPRGTRPDPMGAAFFFGGIAGFFVLALAVLAIFGVPGTGGGTSPSQPQTSGAPQPASDARETTGAAAPAGARSPRQ